MKRKVLVVDDDESVRDIFSSSLRGEGYAIETAADGEGGVDAVRRTFYHLVILDLKMPGMGGLEALRQMKAHDPNLPIVVLTGHPAVETAQETIRSGAADYLSKPLEGSKFRGIVQRYARPSRSLGKVLVVEDDPQALESILAILEAAEVPAEGFSRGDQALLRASRGEGQVFLTDLRLADGDCLQLIARAREARPDLVPIIIASHLSVESAVEAARLGAFDLLSKPVEPGRLVEAVRLALEKSRWEHLPGGLRPGHAYGITGDGRAEGLFAALLARGLAGLWISRDPPQDAGTASEAQVFRLGNHGGPGLPSISGPEQLVYVIEGFCGRGRGVVLFGGVEYLSAQEDFMTAYRTLTALRDLATATNSVLLVTYSPLAFSDQERTLLAKELEILDGDGTTALWGAVASNLTGDVKALYELVRVAGGQKHQADLVVATGFSKPRMSRLLERMERQGLLMRQRDGMGNIVVLTRSWPQRFGERSQVVTATISVPRTENGLGVTLQDGLVSSSSGYGTRLPMPSLASGGRL